MSKRILEVAVIFGLFFIASGCIENTTSHVTKERSDKVASYILDKEPKSIQHRLNVTLGGKATLLGYNLTKRNAKPGGTVDVTWFWKVEREVGDGWRLFTHGVDADGEIKLNRDKVGLVRQHYQPEHWKAGQIIKDQQSIKIPKNWDSGSIELRVGIWKGNDRLKGKGRFVDTANRVKGPVIDLGPVKVKTSDLPYAKKAPKIDGAFEDEAAWNNALKLDPFTNTMNGKPVDKATRALVMWDEKNLYVAFSAEDLELKSKYEKQDDELWYEDAFEIFVDPKADKKDYFEIQVSPKGVVFDSHLPSYRKNQNDWSSKVQVKVKTKGTVNDEKDEDQSWQAEMAIPFASFEIGGGASPKAGDVWSMNFFRIDAKKGKSEYSAWSPPMRGDFHNLDKFGHVTFKGPESLETGESKAPDKEAEKDDSPRDKTEKSDKVIEKAEKLSKPGKADNKDDEVKN